MWGSCCIGNGLSRVTGEPRVTPGYLFCRPTVHGLSPPLCLRLCAHPCPAASLAHVPLPCAVHQSHCIMAYFATLRIAIKTCITLTDMDAAHISLGEY